MRVGRLVAAVDSHTCGEPTRIVIGGAPPLKGRSMADKWEDFKTNHNDFRRFIMTEPRGHSDMFGAIMVPPANRKANSGVIFCDTGGSLSMCGHGSIALASAMVNLRMVTVKEPETKVVLDTPAGLVTVRVTVKDGEAVAAEVRNVPSFVCEMDRRLFMPSLGREVRADICFGGSFFVMLEGEDFGFDLSTSEMGDLVRLGTEAIREANRQFSVRHPLNPHNDRILLAEFSVRNGERVKNCVVFGASNVDRSPCGTGTSAKMALMAARSELKPGEVFRHESIIDTVFEGYYRKTVKVGEYDAIVPYIAGSAHITGFNWLVEQRGDPLMPGFLINQ